MAETLSIGIERASESKLSQTDFDNLAFGKTFTDHMFLAKYENGAWKEANVVPFQPLTLMPGCSCLHYGQCIFEGFKAHKSKDGEVLIFRPEAHIERMANSAKRLAMPPFPEDLFMEGLQELINIEKDWIPNKEGCSLYIRPFMIATDEYLGVAPSKSYLFMIILSPVAAYYAGNVKVIVEQNYVRAAEGGVGSAKCAGNYAASLKPTEEALAKGYQQILWTDAKEHKYIEEAGTMNVMFVIDDVLVTPELTSSLLPGITRDSILKLAEKWGVKTEARKISIDELIEAHAAGKLQDAFGAGTAATITHIETIHYKGQDYNLPDPATRKLSIKLRDALNNIKLGVETPEFDWIRKF